jgi:hypothetical protein
MTATSVLAAKPPEAAQQPAERILIRKFTVGGHAAASGLRPDPISVAPVAR